MLLSHWPFRGLQGTVHSICQINKRRRLLYRCMFYGVHTKDEKEYSRQTKGHRVNGPPPPLISSPSRSHLRNFLKKKREIGDGILVHFGPNDGVTDWLPSRFYNTGCIVTERGNLVRVVIFAELLADGRKEKAESISLEMNLMDPNKRQLGLTNDLEPSNDWLWWMGGSLALVSTRIIRGHALNAKGPCQLKYNQEKIISLSIFCNFYVSFVEKPAWWKSLKVWSSHALNPNRILLKYSFGSRARAAEEAQSYNFRSAKGKSWLLPLQLYKLKHKKSNHFWYGPQNCENLNFLALFHTLLN